MMFEMEMLIFFFFSSRRRHTRFDCDWSSDVCSSDLDLFEPGSTFKVILAAAALSSHAVGPSETFSDPGMIRINGATIHDAEFPGHRTLTLAEIVMYSSNVGAALVATRVGKERFVEYIEQFGFG